MCAFTKTILCMLWGYYLFAPPTFAQRGRPAPPVRTAPAADTVLQRFADGRISVTKVTRVPQHEFVYRVWSPQGIVEQEFEELDYSFRQTVRFAFRQDGSVQEVWVKTIPDAGIQSGHVHYTFNERNTPQTRQTETQDYAHLQLTVPQVYLWNERTRTWVLQQSSHCPPMPQEYGPR